MGRPKNIKNKYSCFCCNYFTSKKNDWDRHIKTKKHKKNSEISIAPQKKEQKLILCKKCGKTYKHQSSYSRHKKKCEFILHKKKANFTAKNANKCSENANKNSESQLSQMDTNTILQKIENIETKIENNLNIKNLNNTNNITINMFLNEHCKNALNLTDFIEKLKITLNDLIESKTLGFAGGISNILINNLNDIPTIDRPIHCINKKALEFVVKEDNEWNSEGGDKKVDKVINSITQERIKKMQEWKKNIRII